MSIFFDLHAHPTSKAFLTDERLRKKKSPWKKLRGGVFQPLAPILKSQSNLTQFDEGNVRLAVMPIVPIEKGFSNLFLISKVLGAFTVLSMEFIHQIKKGHYSYYRLFNDEYQFLKRHLVKGGVKVNILKSIKDFKKGEHFINGIIAIEGSHSLIDPDGDPPEKNLIKIKNSREYSALYLTLTHLTKLKFCNHAYGAKMTKDKWFKPSNLKGINATGFKLASTCYDKEQGKRILVDIKHMSAYSRFQFYQWRKDKGYDDIPILATHMGTTGFALKDLSKYINTSNLSSPYQIICYKESHGIQGSRKRFNTDFNPWSINLYDEEIKIIIESRGLIGISLDQRILGFGKNTEEYFAKKEYDELDNILSPIGIKPGISKIKTRRGAIKEEIFDGPDEFEDLNSFENNSNQRGRRRRHLRYLCNNILHIVEVGGPKAWEHICIGSDFDGLINPINNCKSLADYPELEEDLVVELKIMAREGKGNYHINNLKAKVRNLMFNNGKRFLDTYFTKKYLNK